MRVAVTDTSVFIDLFNLELTESFFELEFELYTTIEVVAELFSEQQAVIKNYESIGRLKIQDTPGLDPNIIFGIPAPKALSRADTSVIYAALLLPSSIVLTADKALRNFSKRLLTECHGMIWIFDRLLAQNIISESDAIFKIRRWTEFNFMIISDAQIKKEVERRIAEWLRNNN